MNEPYETDYRCEAHEGYEKGDRCPRVASQVRREPWTPVGFRVYICDEHADPTYTFDPEATAELLRDIEREEQLEAVNS